MSRPLIRLDEDELTALIDEIIERKLEERNIDSLPDLLTPDEAAELLRCDRRRVYRMHSEGRLAGVKDGARLLIPRAEVERHLRREPPGC